MAIVVDGFGFTLTLLDAFEFSFTGPFLLFYDNCCPKLEAFFMDLFENVNAGVQLLSSALGKSDCSFLSPLRTSGVQFALIDTRIK